MSLNVNSQFNGNFDETPPPYIFSSQLYIDRLRITKRNGNEFDTFNELVL